MKPTLLSLLVLLGLLPLALRAELADPTTATPPLTESQWSTLKSGEVVLLPTAGEPDPRAILGAIIIETPVESVWHVINDKEKGPEFTKGLLRAKVLEKSDSHFLVEQDMKVGAIPGVFTYVIRHDLTPRKKVDFARQSGDLKEVKGYWKFVPVDNNQKTLLVYSLFIDPGFFLPKAILEGSMKRKVPEALREIRARTLQVHPTLPGNAPSQPAAAANSGSSTKATPIQTPTSEPDGLPPIRSTKLSK